jgi:hypothetical protein
MSDAILSEAMALQATRVMLKTAKDRIDAIAWTAERRDATNFGRLLQAVEDADYALFEVLNIAYSRCACPDAGKAIDFALGRVPHDEAMVAEVLDAPEPQSLRA